MDFSYLDRNVESVREKISSSAASSGYDPDGVTLLAAIKSADVDQINYIHKVLGVSHIGENRVQQLLERYDKLDREGLNIHFIGSLQTNKVKYIIDKVCLIHSLDSVKLAREIDKQAKKHNLCMDVLLEINSAMEESKGGVMPHDAESICTEIAKLENVRLRGFMTMAPKGSTKEEYVRHFTDTRALGRKIWDEVLCLEGDPIFSMGMSDSFDIAVECGSTMVRVGGGLFKQD